MQYFIADKFLISTSFNSLTDFRYGYLKCLFRSIGNNFLKGRSKGFSKIGLGMHFLFVGLLPGADSVFIMGRKFGWRLTAHKNNLLLCTYISLLIIYNSFIVQFCHHHSCMGNQHSAQNCYCYQEQQQQKEFPYLAVCYESHFNQFSQKALLVICVRRVPSVCWEAIIWRHQGHTFVVGECLESKYSVKPALTASSNSTKG